MKLHIFNPEHDLALAANLANFTAPHAGRQLRSDLSYIPFLWADEGDFILVDDIDSALVKAQRVSYAQAERVEFVTKAQLEKIMHETFLVDSIHPWGWNIALKHELLQLGTPDIMLPTDNALLQARSISSRKWAASHLQRNVLFTSDIRDLRKLLETKKQIVVKAPWSSSGRGVRYLSSEETEQIHSSQFSVSEQRVQNSQLTASERWAQNIIDKQGGVTIEPYYNKVKDFGMEFETVDGKVRYLGLSIFGTQKNTYVGNLLASEEEKEQILLNYVSREEIGSIRKNVIAIMEPALKGVYSGPFGVDMMVCATQPGGKDCFVNSCIELNLRRTMGHVALAIGAPDNLPQRAMQINYDGSHYHLTVRTLERTMKEE